MLVGDGVVRHHISRGVLREMLVSRVPGIKAVAAVSIEGQPRYRRSEAVGQYRAVIDVAVIGSDRAGDERILFARIRVSHGYGRVVGAGDSQRNRLHGTRGVIVGHCDVVRDRECLALGEEIERAVGDLVGPVD